MILPPPGFAQPIPDASLRPLLEQEMRDLIALARNRAPLEGVYAEIPSPVRIYETRDPALQLARKETKP